MPRTISASLARALNRQETEEVLIVFLKIEHESLDPPIRICTDTVDYIWQGETYIGFPFDVTILSDTDQPPRARLSVQNVDRRIGKAIRGLTSPARLRLDVIAAQWFNESAEPRVPLGTEPVPDYTADKLFLVDVEGTTLTIEGEIASWNYTQETWPGLRGTQDRLPGLFR